MYAVLDIEATGGKKGEESIIELAIYKYDGKKVVDQLISLVSPDREIIQYVQKLTKITPKMVKTAPKFHELAKRVIEITDGAVLVGHNVDFDYRMLRQEFKKLGYNYSRETLDTVSLSEKLFPHADSYSLGKLSKELGIPVSDRHRASGDARATLELLKILLAKDSEKEIVKIEQTEKIKKVTHSGKYAKYFADLPNSIGLFYLHCPDNRIIYMSKSRNIAQDVRKLLTSKSAMANRIRKNIGYVRYEETGNELISWIKENHEIKSLNPKLNSNQKKIQFPFSLCLGEKNGYKTITVVADNSKDSSHLLLLTNLPYGQDLLSLITEEFELCPILNQLSPPENTCLSYQVGECYGACENLESPESYNKRVDAFLNKIDLTGKSFLLIGEGRTLGENSFVWILDGKCKGYGYYELHSQINTEKKIEKRMVPVRVDSVIDSIVKGFLFSEKYRELVPLKNNSKSLSK